MRFGIRELIFFVVLLAVPVASFVYVFKPRNDEIRKAKSEISVKEDRLNRLQEVVATIDDIDIAISDGQAAVDLLESKLPSRGGVETILEQVWSLASQSGLTVKSVKSQESVPAAFYKELPLDMIMEGYFDGYYQFMLQLENLPRITRVHELTLERNVSGKIDDETPEGWVRAEFTLSIYYQPDGQSSIASAN